MKTVKPLFQIHSDYQESLKEYLEAHTLLRLTIKSALSLVSKGADKKVALELISAALDKAEKSAN